MSAHKPKAKIAKDKEFSKDREKSDKLVLNELLTHRNN